ncbi:helix-turn-helix domain-containing protein [Vitreimonas sp.]|uniref:helix-turn-helix domain-containing protein n=1 Tax=Vitreimonas sp. TaxID=3069702 RepID=UPI0039C8F60A
MSKRPQSARQTLALNIIRLRKERGWTQEVLADECGLHRTYVGDIERCARNVSIDNIERFANALSVEIWILLKPHRA